MKKILVCALFIFVIITTPAKSQGKYYPDSSNLIGFKQVWFISHLKNFNEMPIMKTEYKEIYRFLWLRSFHNPVLIKVYTENEYDYYLNVKSISRKGGNNPGKLSLDSTFKLTNNQFLQLKYRFSKLDFFKMKETEGEDEDGLDGAKWILEVNIKGNYHLAERWSPKKGVFSDYCKYLIKISGLNIKVEDVY